MLATNVWPLKYLLTHMHNKKLICIFDLKFSLCALVICGLLINIIKILTSSLSYPPLRGLEGPNPRLLALAGASGERNQFRPPRD